MRQQPSKGIQDRGVNRGMRLVDFEFLSPSDPPFAGRWALLHPHGRRLDILFEHLAV